MHIIKFNNTGMLRLRAKAGTVLLSIRLINSRRRDMAELAEYQSAGKVAVIDLKLLDQVKVAGTGTGRWHYHQP